MKKGEKLELFLLGGHDLEMVEIIKILEQNCKKFEDKKLKWGAKLSDYKEFLNFEGTIYGIELEEDTPPPSNYVEIDHHGKNDHKKSSLEQVAEILGVKLDDDQMLIAANDARYISGMKALCAKQEKIDEIRASDRKIQGITEQDEEKAKESITESDCKNIIFSLTSKFSAVSDLAFYKYDKYVIYDLSKVVFYGYKKEKILELLVSQNLKENDYYYGGGEFGFVGIKEGIYSKEEIENLIMEFKKVQEQETIYSYHTFMLPFTFESSNKKEIIENFDFSLYKENYNEITYFHQFFKDSMFTKDKNLNSAFYKSKHYKNTEMIICKSQEYKLNLKSVNLRLFKVGVGILSFHIENKNYPDLEAILEINDYGRRIYPEYLDENLECSLVPNYIKIGDIREDFKFIAKPKDIVLSKIINTFIPTNLIKPAVDDRMFVISFYKNKEIANELKESFKLNDKWYQYVFVDGNCKSVQNEAMQKKLINRATYARWQQYGSMYGLTKYSFVCLSDNDFALVHMKTIYFQMFSLLLMTRATVLKFSNEVSNIANDIMDKNISQRVSDIYKRYIHFVNNFYFREITPKDQGLELYEKAIDILKIERDIKDLDAEIEELHKYVELDEEKDRTKSMNKISKLGSYLLLPALITSFLGMNIIDFESIRKEYSKEMVIILILASIVVIPALFKVFDFVKGLFECKIK